MTRCHRLAALLLVATLAACAAIAPAPGDGAPTVSLPLKRAWVDGHRVDYVTTDISDAAMARAAGANYVPRLADALPGPAGARGLPGSRRSVAERVYKFPGDTQISVFQSAPNPTGGGNADAAYSPLWRIVIVRWADPARARELKSEDEILSAQDRGEVSLQVTGIVANCPIVRSVDGRALKGVH